MDLIAKATGGAKRDHQTRRLNSKSHSRLGRINTSGILLTQRVSCFMSRPVLKRGCSLASITH